MPQTFNNHNYHSFWFCILGLFFCYLSVQKPIFGQVNTDNWRFDKLSTQDGLSQNTATAFLQDNIGFIWIGTQNGLNRYDGTNFKVFRRQKNASNSLPDNHITALHQDTPNIIWIGTQAGGLVKLDVVNEKFEVFRHDTKNPLSISKGAITKIFRDQAKRLWIGTSEGGLNLFNPDTKTFDHYRNDPDNPRSLAQNYITDIVEDKEGNFWISTMSGGLDYFLIEHNQFNHFKPDTASVSPSRATPSSQNIVGLELEENKLWIATKEGHIDFMDVDTQIFVPLEMKSTTNDTQNTPENNFDTEIELITSFYLHDNQLYIGTEENGLFIVDTQSGQMNRVESNSSSYAISNNHISSVFKDKQNTLWIGTLAEGISKFNSLRNKFEHFREEQNSTYGLPDSRITSIFNTDDNDLWIGTASGGVALSRQNETEKRRFVSFQNETRNPYSLASDKVWKVYQTNDKTIWVGTSKGLNLYDERSNRFERVNFVAENQLSIKEIFQDSKGDIWVGTYKNGLFRLSKDGKVARFEYEEEVENSLSHNHVRVVYEDRIGNLWVGTEKGLNLLDTDNEQITTYLHQVNDSTSISNDEILSINEDDEGKLWIGTANGLNQFDPSTGTFKHYTETDGLPSNIIHGIVSDNQNRIWLSTSKGIAEIDPYANIIREYDMADGVQANEFMSGAVHQDAEGYIYFGGINGFNRFHPDSLNYNATVPNVVFTSFLLFNKEVAVGDSKQTILEESIPYTEEITLPHDANVFSIEFSVLDYIASQKNKYAYYLENFDKEWHYTERNFVTYTNLEAGRYTLKVKGTNSDGIWSDKEAQISISIKPPFWQTWWFRIALTAFIFGVLIGGYRLRTYQIQQQNRKLEQLVEERTNALSEKTWELEHQTTQLEKQNDLLESQSEEIRSAYDTVRTLSEVGQKITATLDMRQMIETVYQNVKNLMPTDRFGIAVFNEELQRLEFPFFVEQGEYFPFHTKSLKDKKRLSVICYETQEELLIQNMERENTKYATDGIEMEFGRKPQSAIYLPLSVEQHTIGVLTVQSFERNAYSEQQITLLRSLAAYTAVALDNSKAYRTIETNNRNITDSIRYALTIQQAMLPEKSYIKQLFSEHFVVFKPLSMVSGDFYWFSELELEGRKFVYAAVIDCTGHGVPGGFMSVIGKTLLNEIVNTQQIAQPNQILERLDKNTRSVLKQDQTSNDDGMDVVIIRKEEKPDGQTEIVFSGAKRPLYIFDKKENKLRSLKGTRRSIGGRKRNNPIDFESQEMILEKGSIIYLSTDGFADQPNPERKKIGSLAVKNLLENISDKKLSKQRLELLAFLRNHQQESAQVDDITMMGLKI